MTSLGLQQPLRLFAPAKVNLGLEVTGRRDDGYHDLVTVLETISLFDAIDFAPASRREVMSNIDISNEEDLVVRALDAVEQEFNLELNISVQIKKEIPVAAGLGGGSSDAGTMLNALGVLLGLDNERLLQIAISLGSDVPFFLRGGTALASGTGTTLTPIEPKHARWYVIVTPGITIAEKTGRLYGELTPDDFASGDSVREFARTLGQDLIADEVPGNSFARTLRSRPIIDQTWQSLTQAGASTVFPSGAGPSLITICDSYAAARKISARIEPHVNSVSIARTVPNDLNLERIQYAQQPFFDPTEKR
jgi:4-diphosphocytidyl-2-C-methyl-D-erythritol kinase